MNRNILRKYFIMGSQNCDRDPFQILEEAALSGITAFQFREKGKGSLQGREKLEFGRKLREICKKYNIPFIINDDIDLVTALDADGIHVGQEDESTLTLRQKFPNLLIGLSISNRNELKNSPVDIVDYVGAGPIFPTNTKTDAKEAVGLEWIIHLREHHPRLPIVGIGGITEDNAQSVIGAGADGIATISAITKSPDIPSTIKNL